MNIIVDICLGFAITVMFFAANLEVQSILAKFQAQPDIMQDKQKLKMLRKRLYFVAAITLIYGCLFIVTAIIILVRSQLSLSAGFWIPGGIGLIIFAAMLFVSGAKLAATNIETFGRCLHRTSIILIIIALIIIVPGLILSALIATKVLQ